ncbi:MAG: hypothetical protein KU37_08065 [Sulfuricurvum sp. PC08-66]|nr:MAG: hypothetical protein KU37_08065 [Sulfuricurvum sp. PC08-66]
MRLGLAWLVALSLLAAESFEDYVKSQNQGVVEEKKAFDAAKAQIEKEFASYQAVIDEEFNNYKKSLGKFWSEPTLSTNKTWVEYSADMKTRHIVDFENETITIEVNAKDANEAKLMMAKKLSDAVTADTQEAYARDTLSQNIDKRITTSIKAPVPVAPILAPAIFATPPTSKEIAGYAAQTVKKSQILSKASKVPDTKLFSMQVKMPANATNKRSELYLAQARQEAQAHKMPLPLVMAIMHSESAFNPMARSHIPAFGLMQIVPKTAGVDTYQHLYNEKRLLSASYLYDSNNNIKIGTAYLSILYYKYLKGIENEQSRLYATIAAYNTGAGNVAKTFSGTYNPAKAAPIINSMSPQKVYDTMLAKLPYDETRHYLDKVSGRVALYQKLYGAQ